METDRTRTERQADSQPVGSAGILYYIDRLEELVSLGKRVPFSARVMVEEDEFLQFVDQLRANIPNEIKQAQRVIKERERIIGEAHEEANNIVTRAQDQARVLVSETTIIAEAKQHSEQLLVEADQRIQRMRGEFDVFVIEQLQLVEQAVRRGMAVMEEAAETTIDTIDEARRAVSDEPR